MTTAQSPTRPSLGLGGATRPRPGLGANTGFLSVKTRPSLLREPGIMLPTGSYVKAKLSQGSTWKSHPVLATGFRLRHSQCNRLDLAGCIIAKAQGDLSTERVQMQATKLSCVSKSGGMFEREVNGFIADDADNSFAVMGSVNTKQDRVAATAFLSA